jgi:hypothetical protein
MKNILLFVFAFFLTVPASAQLLKWQVHDWWPETILEDGNGSTYLARYDAVPDSVNKLVRIGPDGTILWQTPVSGQNLALLYDGGGIYVSPKYNNGSSKVKYIDTTGVLRWTYDLLVTYMCTSPALDKNGNCTIAWQVFDAKSGTVVHLVKLNSAGEKILDAALPPFPNSEEYTTTIYGGPIINASGNVWLMVVVEWAAMLKGGSVKGDQGKSTLYALLLDGNTGSMLAKSTIYKAQLFLHKDDGKGNTLEYDTDGPPYSGFLAYHDNLLAYGTFHWFKNITRHAVQTQEDDRSEWRIALVSPSGKISTRSYKGNGVDRYSMNRNYRTSSDNQGNYLNHVDIGAGNEILLSGTVARGKNQDGLGNFHVEEMLARMDAGTKKFTWTYSNLMPSAGTPQFFSQSVQKFIRTDPSLTCDSLLHVIDVNGRLLKQPLRFGGCVRVNINDSYSGLSSGPSYEAGSLYAYADGMATKYDLSGALAKAEFRPLADAGEQPGTTELQPNYPNPFNPTTTISFDLPSDAYVSVRIYDILGQNVATLADHEYMSAGEGQEMIFDGSGLSSGIYFCRMSVEALNENGNASGLPVTRIRKMMLVK